MCIREGLRKHWHSCTIRREDGTLSHALVVFPKEKKIHSQPIKTKKNSQLSIFVLNLPRRSSQSIL